MSNFLDQAKAAATSALNTASNLTTQAATAAQPALQSAAASVQPALSSMAAGVQPALNSVAQMGSAAAAQAQAGLHSVAPGVVPAPAATTTNTSANSGVDTSHDLTPHSPTTAKLDHFLETRPKQEELQQKNILKGAAGDVLAGKKADLERAQLGTKLEGHLAHRPDPQVLVNEGILTPGEAPPTK